jgi:uncharacterized protein YndB with AHSA1/START domain
LASRRVDLVVPATRADVWTVVGDPRQLPRWWPGVERVEAVDADGFTELVPTRDGRGMRLDFQSSAEPLSAFEWDLELPGTPFARVLTRWVTTVRLSDADDGCTRVAIDERQELRGSFRLGAALQRRPARKRLAGAANGLSALFA